MTTAAAKAASADNELPGLLSEREKLTARIKADEARLGKIREIILDKLGDSDHGLLNGWLIYREVKWRDGYEIEGRTVTYVRVKKTHVKEKRR